MVIYYTLQRKGTTCIYGIVFERRFIVCKALSPSWRGNYLINDNARFGNAASLTWRLPAQCQRGASQRQSILRSDGHERVDIAYWPFYFINIYNIIRQNLYLSAHIGRSEISDWNEKFSSVSRTGTKIQISNLQQLSSHSTFGHEFVYRPNVMLIPDFHLRKRLT